MIVRRMERKERRHGRTSNGEEGAWMGKFVPPRPGAASWELLVERICGLRLTFPIARYGVLSCLPSPVFYRFTTHDRSNDPVNDTHRLKQNQITLSSDPVELYRPYAGRNPVPSS